MKIAVVYEARGKYVKAEPLLLRALSLTDATTGGSIDMEEGHFSELEKLYVSWGSTKPKFAAVRYLKLKSTSTAPIASYW